MIGIPYARVELDGHGASVEICPICGQACPMRQDRYGETILSTYSDHYQREHEEKKS